MQNPINFSENLVYKEKYHIFQMGSRAYGTAGIESDWDYLIYPRDSAKDTLHNIIKDYLSFYNNQLIPNKILFEKLYDKEQIVINNNNKTVVIRLLYGAKHYINSEYTLEIIYIPPYGASKRVNWIIPNNPVLYTAHVITTEYFIKNFNNVVDLIKPFDDRYSYKDIYDLMCYWVYKHGPDAQKDFEELIGINKNKPVYR